MKLKKIENVMNTQSINPFKSIVASVRAQIKKEGIKARVRICQAGKYYSAIQIYTCSYGENFTAAESQTIADMLNKNGFCSFGTPVKPHSFKFEATFK